MVAWVRSKSAFEIRWRFHSPGASCPWSALAPSGRSRRNFPTSHQNPTLSTKYELNPSRMPESLFLYTYLFVLFKVLVNPRKPGSGTLVATFGSEEMIDVYGSCKVNIH